MTTTDAAAARCQRPWPCNHDSGLHHGPPVAESRPMIPPTANRPIPHQVARVGFRSKRIKAPIVSPTATGSARTGIAMKVAARTTKEGHPPNFSTRVPATPTTTISHANETSCAHSDPGGIGPWKRNDPSPVNARAVETRMFPDRRSTTMPARRKADVVAVLTGCPHHSGRMSSQSAAAGETIKFTPRS